METQSPINTDNPPIVDQDAVRPMLAACANCVFFHLPHDYKPQEGKMGTGDCRKDAPTADSRGGAQWPFVHEGLWCGEHPLMQTMVEALVALPLPEKINMRRGLHPLPPEVIKKREEETAWKVASEASGKVKIPDA